MFGFPERGYPNIIPRNEAPILLLCMTLSIPTAVVKVCLSAVLGHLLVVEHEET